MIHLPYLIQDLALLLTAAAFTTILFKKLKQPVVLGYLIAGFLVGPHFNLLPTIKDTTNISIWAEIGVIFMLFGLGLEFSFKRLAKVGKQASITASFEILFMLGVGFLFGQILGWSKMDSLFLGGILAISSTTIIVRAFDELKIKSRNFASLVFGVLVVEDLIAILLLVLLSSVAVTQSLSGSELALSSLRLGFFLVLWFLLGIYLLPILLDKLKNLLTDETLLIVSVGLCLLMVVIATSTGFSPALGAFVMGSILAETSKGKKIEHLILPLKDLFAAVFFVSVGILIDPQVLVDSFPIIFALSLITIFGKLLSSTAGALLSGASLRHSIQSGMSLAQIGEFSFIIATLGVSLKVTSDFLYPIAVAVSAITTFTTPYQMKLADPLANWIEKKLPQSVHEKLNRYQRAMSTQERSNVVSLLWAEYGVKVLFNSVLVIAITLAGSRLSLHYLADDFRTNSLLNLGACFVVILISAPFIWAIIFGRPAHLKSMNLEIIERLRHLQIGITIFRFLIGCILLGFIVTQFTSIWAFPGVILISLGGLVAFFFSQYSKNFYQRIESKFLSNLNESEKIELEKKSKIPQLAPWNATLTEFVVSPSSRLVGKNLQESGIKEVFGVTVAMAERGSIRTLAPSRDHLILPSDKLYVIGTDEQLVALKEIIEPTIQVELPPVDSVLKLTSIQLVETDSFINKTLRECGLREAVQGLIVGLERNGQRFLSPDSSMTLMSGDLIWMVGDPEKIKNLRNQN